MVKKSRRDGVEAGSIAWRPKREQSIVGVRVVERIRRKNKGWG